MGSIRRARILLKACLGQLLANAPVQSQGEAWLSMAKCEIAEVSLGDPPSSAAESNAGRESPVEGRGGVAAGEGAEAEAEVGRRARRGVSLKRAVLHLDWAIAKLKRCHDFAGLRECLYLKVIECVVQFREGREGM